MVYTAYVKSVHQALQLRHHKHTGKLLEHKHTSYRVLFLLMLVPIIAMAMVEQVVGASDDIVVSAKIPAPMPAGAPVITSPVNGATINSKDVVVSGTCPVITPAVVIALYDGDTLIGSVRCSVDGIFSLPVTVAFGRHVLVATVVTITNDIGASSQPVTITYEEPVVSPEVTKIYDELGASKAYGYGPPVRIVASDIYVLLKSDGHAVWHGRFADGTLPYTVRIDWGDGNVSTYNDVDRSDQAFSHDYRSIETRKIIIEVTDANGGTSTLYSVVVTLSLQQRTVMNSGTGVGAGSADDPQNSSPVMAFIKKYIWQIYIGTLSSLTFLWYIEHGRHLVARTKHIGRLHHR